jgi:HSA
MEELIEQRYQILQRTSQQREKIGGRRLPRIREPTRPCTHWDYFLEEMKWLANDFIEDRKHKQAVAFVLITEIRLKKIRAEKKEAKKEEKSRKQAKRLSEMVMKYFFCMDDGRRFNEKEAPAAEKYWRVVDIINSPPVLNIVLENSKIKKNTKIDLSKPIHKYALSIIHNFGYSSSEKIEDIGSREPSTPDTGMQENDLEHYETLTNFKLFYDAEWTEKDLNQQLEELHLEELDVYRPLTTENIEFRDITHEEALFEEELFELVPDSEEYTLWESTKQCLENKDSENFYTGDAATPNYLSFKADYSPFAVVNSCKRDWKIFEDMILEKSVCEFGGNWEFISDFLSSHPLCLFNYVTPEECFNRWASLQKRKGRAISNNFRPPQVFQNEYAPVQFILSKFSINKKSHVLIQVPNKPMHETWEKIPHNTFSFYLKHNVRPEVNNYFINYKKINSKYYNETSMPMTSYEYSNDKSTNSLPKTSTQIFIDKEEENSMSVAELLESNKNDNEVHNGTANTNGKASKTLTAILSVKKK